MASFPVDPDPAPPRRGLGLALRAVAVVALLGLGALLGALVWLTRDLPSLAPLEDYRPALPSIVVDRNGRPVAEFYAERRRLTPLREVPPVVVDAFLASEDASFFAHGGVDVGALVRASLANLRAGGEVRQGGSTITQQLAKNLLLTPERTVVRKLRDIALALRIERALPKQRILEIYLNDVYLGRGAYGVAQAAQAYFGKELADVDVSEAALLAGLTAAPTRYSPARNPEAADARRRWVLERMGALGKLTPEEVAAAQAERPLVVARVPPAVEPVAVAFVEEVRLELFARLGEETVRRGGLRIETTLDLELQRRAVHALRAGLESVDRRKRGWSGPETRVAADALDATIAGLRATNGLLAERRGPTPLPEARTLRGVVVGLGDGGDGGARARIALAPGVEAALHWEDAKWAARGDARSLAKLLAVGDVAFFEALPDAPADAPRVRLLEPPAVQGALASVEVATGEVLALVGGYDDRPGQFNRATQARRQPGSAFKPFVYGAALEAGFTTSSVVYDYQVETYSKRLGRWWRPKNAGGVLRGPVPIFEAFARSLNNATIRLLDDVGTERVASYARRAGIASPLAVDRSLALGTSEVTPLELTAAYATFARGGEQRPPRLVRRVLDRDERVLAEGLAPSGVLADAPAPPDDEETAPPDALAPEESVAVEPPVAAEPAAIAPVDAYLVTHLMRGVIRRGYGTGHAAAKLDAPLAGKTGTTNRNRDAWFVGYSPRVATGVWVGYDAPTQDLGRSESGGRAALPIWIDFMAAALPRFPDDDGFDLPAGLHFAWTDGETNTAQRSQRYVAWAEPFATGRKQRRSSFVPPPTPPEPEPEFAPASAPAPTLGAYQGAGAPAPAAPLVE